MKKFSILLCLVLSCSWGQTPPPGGKPETARFEFSVFPLAAGNWRGIFYSADGVPSEDAIQLSFNPRERSRSYSYAGPLPLQFFRWSIDAEGKQIPQVVGTVQLKPEEKNGPLVLFFDEPGVSGLYKISVLHDSDQNFPNESILFFNTMDISFMGVLGGGQLVIPPGKSEAISFKNYLNDEVPIALAIRHDGDLHLVANNNIRFSAERRILMILRPPARPGSLRIRTQRLTEFTGARGEDSSPQQANGE